jgi:hypothetical protein
MIRSESNLFFTEKSKPAHFVENPGKKDIIEQLASRVQLTYGSIGRALRSIFPGFQDREHASAIPSRREELRTKDRVK